MPTAPMRWSALQLRQNHPGMLMASLRLNIPVIFRLLVAQWKRGKPSSSDKIIKLDRRCDDPARTRKALTSRATGGTLRVPTCTVPGCSPPAPRTAWTEALGLSQPGNGSLLLATHADRSSCSLTRASASLS